MSCRNEIRACEYLLLAATRTDPAEWCDAEAEPDGEFCEAHVYSDEDHAADMADEQRQVDKEGGYEL